MAGKAHVVGLQTGSWMVSAAPVRPCRSPDKEARGTAGRKHSADRRHACASCACARAGEIIPQALCTRYGLAIGAYSAWFVWALMWVVGIVSWPISKVLDWVLGTEHGVRAAAQIISPLVHASREGKL